MLSTKELPCKCLGFSPELSSQSVGYKSINSATEFVFLFFSNSAELIINGTLRATSKLLCLAQRP